MGRKPVELGPVINEIEEFLKENGQSSINKIVNGISYGRLLVEKAIYSNKIKNLKKNKGKYCIISEKTNVEFLEIVDVTRLGLSVDVHRIGKTLRIMIGLDDKSEEIIKMDLGSIKERKVPY
ncbi:MAG: hypothetical protein ACTSQ8_19220 [Candidatus Helarchaeota archaeon]